jgi:D-alanyl-D-alanine carboxypeptidase/D-alanyl-D-alanine-endopeptidase (penicillin-binding protein 4)
MKKPTVEKAIWLSIVVFISFITGLAQSAPDSGGTGSTSKPPLPQQIQVYKDSPGVSSTPYIKKTSIATSTALPEAEMAIPGYSGILVETLDGKVVSESSSNAAFNPASNVKIATAYAVLKTFGPEFRFATDIWTDGTLDKTTGTLYGNLYVSGRDPMFNPEHAVVLSYELNRLGIRTVSGDMVVTDNFALGYSASAARSGQSLFAMLDMSKRSPAATRAWLNYVSYSGRYNQTPVTPSVTFTGSPYVQSIPSNLKLLFRHESAPLREIIKVTLCYSNNFLAERLGDMLGGPYAVARTVQLNAGIPPEEFYLQTSSGLGLNRVTPRAMMKLLRALRSDLGRYRMTFADIMPVAGIDKGTLENRFDTDFATGSVVGKTGTLGNTDGGVSALAGEINTRKGKLLFVIFNQRGGVQKFRAFQNNYISLLQAQFGGPLPMAYNPISLDVRLAKTRVTYPDSRARMNDEE